MTELEFQVTKSVGFLAALALAVGLQARFPHRGLAGSWRSNSRLWAINAVVLGAVCAGCACTVSRWAADSGLGFLNVQPMAAWSALLASVLGLDLVSYFWHRANHRFTFLWRFHQAHHSDVDYTVTTALRFHPAELLLALPVRLVAVVLLGVPVAGVVVFEVLFAFANFYEHGDIDLPPELEKALSLVVLTPALHRRHHSRRADLLNSNYGTIFSVWDRLLGSYGENTSAARVDTGLPGLDDRLRTRDILQLPLRGVFRGN